MHARTAISSSDRGKTVSIRGDVLLVDGAVRLVSWSTAKHDDINNGTITSVEECVKGKVLYECNDGTTRFFENPMKRLPRYACPNAHATFNNESDKGRIVEIKGDKMKVDGIAWTVCWGDTKDPESYAKHADCAGKIETVEPRFKGKVKLNNGLDFENPAGTCMLVRMPSTIQCNTEQRTHSTATQCNVAQCKYGPAHVHRLFLLYQRSVQ